MKKAVFSLLVILFGTISCLAEDGIHKVVLPDEVKQEMVSPTNPDISKLVWNRWTSKSFTVCSLDDKQAEWLVGNLENIKTWIYTRWGLPDASFVTECRLICVNDPALFEKFFGLKDSRVENRKNIVVIFFLLNQPPSQVVPLPLTEASLYEFERAYNSMKFPVWSRRGMGVLNCTLNSIRNDLLELQSRIDKDEQLYFSKGLLTMDQARYDQLDSVHRHSYDLSASVLCLMLRKEFGQNPFQHFIKQCSEGDPEKALRAVYSFEDYKQLDSSLKQYMVDLVTDVKSGKTPNSYLQVTPLVTH